MIFFFILCQVGIVNEQTLDKSLLHIVYSTTRLMHGRPAMNISLIWGHLIFGFIPLEHIVLLVLNDEL